MERTTSGLVVRVNPDTYYYKWLIHNIYIFRNDPKSPRFTTGVNNENTWCLEFTDCSGLSITLLDTKEDIVNVSVKVYSPTRKETEYKYVNVKLCLKKGEYGYLDHYSEFRCAVNENDFSYLPSNGITIICEITHLKRQTAFEDHSLLNDLKLTLQNGENSDITIVVGKKEFRVHKFMLALRSPVFSAMFKHNMKESQQNVIEVTDIDQDIMEILLEYIYTGILKDIGDAVDRLLIAADKYALDGLKSICSKRLIETITTENMCEMIKLADQYQADDLKESILDYSLSNRKKVMAMPEYKSISDIPFFSLRQILVRCGRYWY